MATDRSAVLITGASAGIGRELARVFASHGHDLVVVARREERLKLLAEELEGVHAVEVRFVAMDLSPPDAHARLFEEVRARGVDVGVLVNNAGVLEIGPFREMDSASVLHIVQMNAALLTGLTSLFVPHFVERGAGRILNVASVAAFQPIPSLAVYAATKAFVLSLTEALSEELRDTGVTVTALCPGLTDTEMADHVKESSRNVDWLPSFAIASADKVAEDGYRACMEGRVIQIPGFANQVAAAWVKSQPRWVVRAIGGLVGRRIL